MDGIEPDHVRESGSDRYECLGCGRRVERESTPVECSECGSVVRNLSRPFGE